MQNECAHCSNFLGTLFSIREAGNESSVLIISWHTAHCKLCSVSAVVGARLVSVLLLLVFILFVLLALVKEV